MTYSRRRPFDVIIVYLTVVCAAAASYSYKAMTKSVADGGSNAGQCATDAPTETLTMKSGSTLRCGNKCDKFPCCVAYQFDKDVSQCQLYNYTPTAFVEKRNCKAFAAGEDARLSVSAERDCSFPFTYNEQLYYSCVVDSTIPCNGWCFLPHRIARNCSYPTYGYVAQIMTVSNITTPNNVIQLTLMSVGGWLTIFSRIYSNWPLSLTTSNYVNGFGSHSTNMWIGLENLYWLTNTAVNGGKSYKLRFEIQSSLDAWYSIEYDWFYIDNAASSYTTHASVTSYGDVADVFNDPTYPSNGKPFAYSGGTCFSRFGGWWYTDNSQYCSRLRFFGGSGTDGGLWWKWIGNLNKTRILIK